MYTSSTRAVLSFQNFSTFISELDKPAVEAALSLYEALIRRYHYRCI